MQGQHSIMLINSSKKLATAL
ncbi:hypothetical protein AZE42_10010 [Rhizopogon vesiculosus]|uniref:Uncharacterized protein n=1 Tax=Rhizopogon vesiculosus TaxID=180088 RepID=A0A1J8Q2B3_9AGAM|nr:hypothetical protein AZE42_10010 [Rhizopogon vesiculosus]